MERKVGPIFVLLSGLWLAVAGNDRRAEAATPAEQLQTLAKEFNAEGFALRQATTDEERERIVARVEKLTGRLMELAQANPKDPAAIDALVQAVVHELWMENNTPHTGRGQDNPETRAIAILLREHLQSEKMAEATRRMSYGFSQECERFIRTVLEKSPHQDVRGLACLRLAQFLNGRLQRTALLKDRPEMARRYEGLFGREYVANLMHQDPAKATAEIESLFEQAAREYGDVKVPYGNTVAEKAKSELHEIRHLSVGKQAPDLEGDDQDGGHFKLSDYRGKVVLLYFWSEY